MKGVNYDYPIPLDGKMAKAYLWQIEKDAHCLREALGDHDQMPGWVNLYIYTSADRLQAASRYMQYQVWRKSGKGCTYVEPAKAKHNVGLPAFVQKEIGQPITPKKIAIISLLSVGVMALFLP